MTHHVPSSSTPVSAAARLHPWTLPRPRVHAAIDESVRAQRITVVRAPSGFGKTSAVRGWSADHQQRVAWVTLGHYDDEPSRLGAQVVRAIQALAAEEPRLRTIARADPAAAGSPELFDALQQALQSLPHPIFLVVDDAHRAGDALTSGLVGALVQSGSENLRMVFVGTGGLDAGLSRWTLGAPNAVIGERLLAFDLDETSRVLAAGDDAIGLDVNEVFASTRGWPIAVQFSRLSGRADHSGADDALLREYVRDSVLRDVPAAVRSLALHTAVCERLTVPLAAAVTDRADAGALLSRAVRLGLFLDTVGTGDSLTYRWHPLFARLCRAINDEEDPERNLRAHRAAARHLEHDDPFAAIDHWHRAGEPEAVVRVIVERWMRIVIGADAAALDRICGSLPAPFHDDPAILLVRACAHDVLDAPHSARTFLAQAVARAGAKPDANFQLTLPRAQLFLLDDRTDLAAAAEKVHAELVVHAQPDRRGRATLLFLMGWAGMRHRLTPWRTVDQLRSAAREADALGDAVLAARARRLLAFVLAWAGALSAAREVLDELGADGDDTSPWLSHGGGATAVAAGMIAFWADDGETAAQEFSRVLGGARAAPSFRGVAAVMLALTAARTGDEVDTARAVIELEALPRGERHGVSWHAFHEMAVAAVAAADGRMGEAVAIARDHRAGDLPLVTMVLAEILRRSGDVDGAMELLRALGPYREVSYVRASTLLTAALLHRERGADRLAHEYCEQALEVGEREGLSRIFTGAEGSVRTLLAAHLERGTAYEALAARGARSIDATGPAARLSPRERAVLDLLATSKSSSEIAQTLGMSANTLKTHTRAIYRKLGVSSRQEAVQAVR